MRSYKEAATILCDLYGSKFCGKSDQRYLIDIHGLRNVVQNWNIDIVQLQKEVSALGFYLLIIPSAEKLFAVIEQKTVDRWRKVPNKIIRSL